MTELIAAERVALSVYWHNKQQVWLNAPNFTFQSKEAYSAFHVAKDWIQDTSEVLSHHRSAGFASHWTVSYLELYGVLQAVFVQQDAIKQLHNSLKPESGDEWPSHDHKSGWQEIRRIRNLAIGHPTEPPSPRHNRLSRCVIDRDDKTYDTIRLKKYPSSPEPFEIINLGDLIDRYDAEGAKIIARLQTYLNRQVDKFT